MKKTNNDKTLTADVINFVCFFYLESIFIAAVAALVLDTQNRAHAFNAQCIFKYYTAVCNMHTVCWLSFFVWFFFILLHYYFGFLIPERNCTTQSKCVFLWTRNRIANQCFIKYSQNGLVALFLSNLCSYFIHCLN